MKISMPKITFSILTLLGLIVACSLRAEDPADAPELNLPWPYDFEVRQGMLSRDIVFNDKAPEQYLARARKLYVSGYMTIKSYEGVKDASSPFIRDPYKVMVREVRNLSFRDDFAVARNKFTEAYAIFTENLQWDASLRQKPEYKELLKKIVKGLIQTTIYMKDLFRANDYLDTYVSLYPEDKVFSTEYRVKIISMLVDRQESYEVWYHGDKSADAIREKYQLLIQQYVADRPDLDPTTKAWIIDRAAPKWSTKDFNTRSIDTNYGK